MVTTSVGLAFEHQRALADAIDNPVCRNLVGCAEKYG